MKAFALLKNSTNPQCQRFIIFVTDGQNQDYGQRCSAGEFVHSEEMTRPPTFMLTRLKMRPHITE